MPAADGARTSADSMPAADGGAEPGTAADAAGSPADGEQRIHAEGETKTEPLQQAEPQNHQQQQQQQQEQQQQLSEGVTLCAYTQPFPKDLQGRPCVHWLRKGSQPLQLAELEAAVTCTLLPEGPTVQSLQQVGDGAQALEKGACMPSPQNVCVIPTSAAWLIAPLSFAVTVCRSCCMCLRPG